MNKIEIKKSTVPEAGLGVFAKQDFQKHELLDEYKGIFLTPHEYKQKKSHLAYIWEILDENDNPVGYIDAGNKKTSNWTRFVNCPCTKKQENVIPIQKGTKMFYYAKKNIKKGEELFVWYGPEYGKQLIGRDEL